VTRASVEPPKRRTADERRVEVIDAAVAEFATRGYHGGSTETIAAAAGISQPYVLRLFGTKKALFIAAVTHVGDRIMALWREKEAQIDRSLPPEERLRMIGEAYEGQMNDVTSLRLLLQSFAACDDPEIRAACHRCMEEMHAWVVETIGASPEAIQHWFAIGMMLTVAAAIGAPPIADKAEWARMFTIPLDS
jgi:AcrR family transcriptional regulator